LLERKDHYYTVMNQTLKENSSIIEKIKGLSDKSSQVVIVSLINENRQLSKDKVELQKKIDELEEKLSEAAPEEEEEFSDLDDLPYENNNNSSSSTGTH
jgi:hypothetical protein